MNNANIIGLMLDSDMLFCGRVYGQLRALRRKVERLESLVSYFTDAKPVDFVSAGKLPWSDHVGWDQATAWFYTDSVEKDKALARYYRAKARVPSLKDKAHRARLKMKAVRAKARTSKNVD